MTEELTIKILECEKGHKEFYLEFDEPWREDWVCQHVLQSGQYKKKGPVYYRIKDWIYCYSKLTKDYTKTFVPKGSEAKMIFEKLQPIENRLRSNACGDTSKERNDCYHCEAIELYLKIKKELIGDEK